MAQHITVVGAGYVGLTSAACFARLGHQVLCVDVDEAKVAALSRGEVSLHEQDLAATVAEGMRAGRLRFRHGLPHHMGGTDFVFIAVPTPTGADGEADLTAVESVLQQVRDRLSPGCVVVIKSTVPVGSVGRVVAMLDRPGISVVSNPEFLREGHAVEDFLHPQRIVVGSENEAAARRVAALYAVVDAPMVMTDSASAELVKYASNSFLAMKLSYVNTLAELCEQVGADIADVTDGMRLDQRIGATFLTPGPGWGGSCLPKDTRALLSTAVAADVDFALLEATIATNDRQARRVVDKVRYVAGGSLDGVRIGLWGLTFKAGTDDLRDSPALAVAGLLAEEGAALSGFDPCVPAGCEVGSIRVVDSPYAATSGATVLVVLTEWPEFAEADWTRLAGEVPQPVIVDTRGLLPARKVREAGLRLHSVGTPDVARHLRAG